MNVERLLALYERLADAPDAIARLRRFVLNLAVRGKLVEQDPADEPASELLKRIAAEKARLGFKSSFSRVRDDEAPFELPEGWSWTCIGEICSKTGSGSTPRGGKDVYKKVGVPFLRSQNVYDEGLRLDDVAYIDVQTHERMSGTRVLPGDLLLNITGGSMGRCGRVPEEFGEANVSQHVAIIRPAISSGMAGFLHSLILSPYFQAFIFEEQTGAGRGGLPKNRMDRIAVALPPLAEQQRIVAKVEELMALLDRLEAARERREATRDRLSAASLARLTAPDTEPEEFPAHARFVLDALPALTSRPDQIKSLRRFILDLAVRGKLVEQDPTDEPAWELLNRLNPGSCPTPRTKVRPSSVAAAGVPFDCPAGWSWAQVRQILAPRRDISYGVIKLGPEPKSGGVPTLRCSDVRPGFIDLSGVRKVEEAIEAVYARTRLEGGEILINIRGTLGGVALVPDNLKGHNIAREVAVIPFANDLSGPFLVYLMLSPYFWDHIQSNLRGIAYKGLNLRTLRDLPLPLPPRAEQHRIVAKVDALMSLCDRLEASLSGADTSRAHLLESLLHKSLAPSKVAVMGPAE